MSGACVVRKRPAVSGPVVPGGRDSLNLPQYFCCESGSETKAGATVQCSSVRETSEQPPIRYVSVTSCSRFIYVAESENMKQRQVYF